MSKDDRKSRGTASDIESVVRAGTAKWTKTAKAEEGHQASRSFRRQRLIRERRTNFH
jgi:hypothetical protein